MIWDWAKIDFATYEGTTADDTAFFLEIEQAHYWYPDGYQRSADFEEPAIAAAMEDMQCK